jgi:arylsulfatase A-like enzyme
VFAGIFAREVESMRRSWLKYGIVVAVLAVITGAVLTWAWRERLFVKRRYGYDAYTHEVSPDGPKDLPNVIVFVIDATRRDALSPYGTVADERTPNIAKLARTGVVFDASYATTVYSGPSYASIITGKYPLGHGVYDHPNKLPLRNRTILETASEAGFYTLHVTQHGFLRKRWQFHQGAAFYRFTKNYNILIDDLVSWISHHRETPFVAFVAVTVPHFPYTPWKHRGNPIDALPKAERKIVRTITKNSLKYDFASTGLSEAFVAAQRENYQLEVETADQLVGRVMEAVEQSGRREKTAVIVTADHGEAFGEHGLHFVHDPVVYGPASNVPLIISWPGRIKPGRVASVVSLIDLLPTVAEWIGAAVDDDVDGRSLVPLLEGGHGGVDRTVFCYSRPRWEDGKTYPVLGAKYQLPSFAGSSVLAARNRWDVVMQPLVNGFAVEVFDRAEDPLHLEDLWSDRADQSEIQGMVTELHDYRDRLLAATMSESELSEEQLAGLRELGYIE